MAEMTNEDAKELIVLAIDTLSEIDNGVTAEEGRDVAQRLRALLSDWFPTLAVEHMADKVRGHLRVAKLTRSDLFTKKELKRPFGTHCFRRSFVTRSLALGRNEDWVRRRTGHESDELLRYRQEAKELAHAGVRGLDPLSLVVPELNDSPRDSPREHREGGGTGRRARFRFGFGAAEPQKNSQICDPEPPETGPDRTPNGESVANQNAPDPVEVALADALRRAAIAGAWSTVERLAGELEARRKGRANSSDAEVVTLESARRKK